MSAKVGEAITRSFTVRCSQDHAFRTWIERINDWWPKDHSLSHDPKTTVILEAKSGGRFFERASDGREYHFGSVTHFEPPSRLIYQWYLGSSAELPTEITLNFTAESPSVTRVDLEHRGPDLIGSLWDTRSSGFARAWNHVIPCYANACVSPLKEKSS